MLQKYILSKYLLFLIKNVIRLDGLISVDICIFFVFMQKLYLEKANYFEKSAP